MEDKIVYDGWLKLFKRTLGNKTYEILKNHDAVAVFIINDKEQVLLVKQFRPAVMQETLEIPAGVMDINEEIPEDCAIREIYEETGIEVNKHMLRKMVEYKPMMGFSVSTMHIFMVNVEEATCISQPINDDEVASVEWIHIKDLDKKIKNGDIFDGKTLMAYFYYKTKIRQNELKS